MPTISIPMNIAADAARLQRLFRNIIDHDQLDDWLPDCVYFRDFDESPTALLAKSGSRGCASSSEPWPC